LKVEERYEPFTYVWDRSSIDGPMRSARAAQFPKQKQRYLIVRRYFEIGGIRQTSARSQEFLQIDPAAVESAARRLEREKLISRGLRIGGLPGVHSVLREFL